MITSNLPSRMMTALAELRTFFFFSISILDFTAFSSERISNIQDNPGGFM